jgi:hypothetical protein
VGVLINTSLGSTTTTLVSSQNPSNFGQAVTFTATVTPSQFFKFQFTGTVTFTYGSTTLCNAVTLSGRTATCASSALPVGSDVVTATYSGDANFTPSSGTVSQTVSFGIGPPTNKDQCKNDGWKTFTIPRQFKNQGDCVSFVNTGK